MLSVRLLQRRARPQALSALYCFPRRCLSTPSSRRVLHVDKITSHPSRPQLKRFATVNASTDTRPTDDNTVKEPSPITETLQDAADTPYHGPLTTTFRRLKIFSLSSLTLTFALTPFIFVMETTSALPLAGRFALAGIAIATSGVSTALVAWCGKPYVTTLRWLPAAAGGARGVEMTTLTLGLHERVTRVYDGAFLVPASRPFATWELAEAFQLPSAEVALSRGREEMIAETSDNKGGVVGRWIVKWDEHGAGSCREVGKVARYFNVHQDLLDRPIR